MLRSKFHIRESNKASIKHNTDFVFDNFIEAEVKKVLWPLYVAQCLSLAPKYSIRYGLITSNSSHFYAIVSLLAIGIAASWFYLAFDIIFKSGGLLSTALFAYGITFTSMFVFNSTVTTSRSNTNAYLITLIQRIQKGFEYVKFNPRNITIVNWLYVIAVIAFNILHFTLRLIEVPNALFRIFCAHLMYISNDFNLIIEVRTIHLLGKYIETWISELESICCPNSLDDRGSDYVRNMESAIKKLVTAYDKVIEALDICNQAYGLSILFMVVTSIFQVFFNVQYVILLPVWSKTMYMSQTLWIKNITLLTMLCMECENVSLKLKNAKVACIVPSTLERSPELCSYVLRQQDARPRAGWLSAAGFFSIDATLPPSFLAVLATYTIVILQFHFL
nr:gustatory receptor 45 [Papilio memnon]